MLLLRDVPARLVVIGAGPIGLELGPGALPPRLGRDASSRPPRPCCPGADPEIGEALHELLEGEGIEIVCGAEVERVGTGPDGRPRVAFTADGVAREADGDALLLGAGRGPSVDGPRPGGGRGGRRPQGHPRERAPRRPRGRATTRRGTCSARPGARTPTSRGSSAATPPRTPSTSAPTTSTPDPGPRAIFTDPEFATVGMTEKEARRAGHDVGVGLTRFSGGKARAWGQERGLVKVVADRATRRILGAHVLAYHAADLVHPVVVAMRAGSADPLLDAFHIHPTLGEPVQGAARSALAG